MKTDKNFLKEIRETESIDKLKELYKESTDTSKSISARIQELNDQIVVLSKERADILEKDFNNWVDIKQIIKFRIGELVLNDLAKNK